MTPRPSGATGNLQLTCGISCECSTKVGPHLAEEQALCHPLATCASTPTAVRLTETIKPHCKTEQQAREDLGGMGGMSSL